MDELTVHYDMHMHLLQQVGKNYFYINIKFEKNKRKNDNFSTHFLSIELAL